MKETSVKNKAGKKYSFEWLYTNKAIAIISVIVSVICWVLTTLYISADASTVIIDVPIRINTEDVEEFHGLQMISIIEPAALSDGRVDVEVSGSIHEISRVSAEDITVTAQVSNVSSSGEHTLALTATCSGHNVNVKIHDGYSNVRVWFDRVQQKRLTVERVLVNGVSTESDGLIIGDYYSALKSLVIQGPESVVENISSVYITADVNRPLAATETVAASVCYVNADGEIISDDESRWVSILDYNDISAETDTMAGEPPADILTVTIPIRKRAEVGAVVQLKNVPEGFDAGSLTYSINPSVLVLEGDIDAIDKRIADGGYKLESIDLSQLSVGNRSFSIPLNLTSGVTEVNGVSEVNVTFAISGYATREFRIENNGNFSLVNSGEVAAEIETDEISFLVIGPREQVDRLTEDDFTVMADMSTYDGQSGQRPMPAVIRIAGADCCWVCGSYTLMVTPRG